MLARLLLAATSSECFVGCADGGRPSWLTTCVVREFCGTLCGSWWPGFYTDQIDGRYQRGRHHGYSVGPASADPYSGAVAQPCGAALVRDSLAIVVGPGVYSDQVSHMHFLDRNGRALLYRQHT